MVIAGLSEETRRALLLSVGSHRQRRPMTPLQVGAALDAARRSGTSLDELREFLHLEDESVLRRFLNLLTLSPDVKVLVDWKRTETTIPFTAGSEIAKLPTSDHRTVAEAIIRHSLSTEEVKQLIQLCRRSTRSAETCIQEILRFRPTVEIRQLFIGGVSSADVRETLAKMGQEDRDQLFATVLRTVVPAGTVATGRLTEDRFSVVGGADLAPHFGMRAPTFEELVNERLAADVARG
jgi:hypothetical protein